MKFSYVTFVPNKQQQQQQKKGKRSKPLSMVSYFTDTERFSTSNPFNGSLDLSLHFNVETQVPSSRRHVPPPVQIVIPTPPQPLVPQTNALPLVRPEQLQPIPPRPIPVREPNTNQQVVDHNDHNGSHCKLQTVLCRPLRKPRYARSKDLCYRETMSPVSSSKSKQQQQHLTRSTRSTTTGRSSHTMMTNPSRVRTTTISSTTVMSPPPQKYDRARMIAPATLNVNHIPTVLSHSGLQQTFLVSNSNGQREMNPNEEETSAATLLSQHLTLTRKDEHAPTTPNSCSGSLENAETTTVPRKVRTSISLFELLNPEDDESL
ncbi:hypothetical protein FDP41_004973 [Naegleria fowleri]|uniref:Uncharacterized protein n=1 Tax=Naegleria fowleri TaxID=5763 RepID=A0A6A5BG86_NAEFO|nr:uncharacterized protein FDP41_004973 [Naegleria fowleri]KAF0976007.1 hypothetical protein FDP41_004973 [Naegleria fowleri]